MMNAKFVAKDGWAVDIFVNQPDAEKLAGGREIATRAGLWIAYDVESTGGLGRTAEVKVPDGALNKFALVEPIVDDGVVTGFAAPVNLPAVMAAWEAAGFPLEWNPVSDDDEHEGPVLDVPVPDPA